MITGIGTDIIEIERIKKTADNPSFLRKIFSEAEMTLFHGNNYETLAGNFAAKEAFAKAMGTGFKGCAPNEINVLRMPGGKPYIVLDGNTRKIWEENGKGKILVTISHCKEYATATVIIEQ
jgi:holo-[acyl-carrier protein] synthase